MANITLITGGARSGKSSLALRLALKISGTRAFIATAAPLDDEMQERIRAHRKERGDNFVTIEEQINLEKTLGEITEGIDIVIIDCLTVWLGNLFYHYKNNKDSIRQHIDKFLLYLEKSPVKAIVFVTNEVGSGIIPEHKSARLYRDCAGFINSSIAAIADAVYHCVCGIPQKIK